MGTGGVLYLTGSGSVFTATTATGLTTTGTGKIALDSASGKTFAGGGASYPKLSNEGAGVITVTGANTFADITNTVQPTGFILPSSTVTTVSTLTLAGTSGSLVTIDSSTGGIQASLSKASGSITVSYLDIQDSLATGGATWNADNGTNVNSGNNTGWVFPVVPSTGNFLSFF